MQKVQVTKKILDVIFKYLMRNAGLEEPQAGIKIAGININNLRYADDTTFMAEREEIWVVPLKHTHTLQESSFQK